MGGGEGGARPWVPTTKLVKVTLRRRAASRVPISFKRDIHHGKLQVLRNLRPAAVLQTSSRNWIKNSANNGSLRGEVPNVSPSDVATL